MLGGGAPRGICGSGLVDAVAAGLDLGWIEPSGRLEPGRKILHLDGRVQLSQSDIRQLQLAKGSIAAGLEILLERIGATRGNLSRVNLAGAFGNYVDRDSARRIGLLDYPAECVEPVGNTALLGAKLALFAPEQEASGDLAALRAHRARLAGRGPRLPGHVFIDALRFPELIGSSRMRAVEVAGSSTTHCYTAPRPKPAHKSGPGAPHRPLPVRWNSKRP